MLFLVTGATGSVGRLLVDHLLAAGAQVRALTNNPTKAALPAGVELVEGFIGKPETLPAALEGVDRMYLAPFPRTVREVVQRAKQAGVQRIVDLSSATAAAEAEGDPSGWHYYAVEHAVEESGVPWTHLRPGEFMNNMLDWAEQIRSTGVVRAGYAQAANTLIDLDDIAAVAATVLLEDGHIGKTYDLSGPEAIRRIDIVKQIGLAIGRELRFEELSYEEALADLSVGMGEYARWYVDYLAESAKNPPTPDLTVTDFTGKPATTFAQWAVQHANAFR